MSFRAAHHLLAKAPIVMNALKARNARPVHAPCLRWGMENERKAVLQRVIGLEGTTYLLLLKAV